MPPLSWIDLKSKGTSPKDLPSGRAQSLVETLGWLAPWWLQPAVISRAAELQPAYASYSQRPALPGGPGGCWVVFVQTSVACLRPAFLLPLTWQADREDDPHLPEPLKGLAEQVREQFPDNQERTWGLCLARPEREKAIDLSALDGELLGAGSAWASLAGGLVLARDGSTPNHRVWASATWDGTYGIGPVAGLDAKLDLAAEWGANEMFVPAQNQSEVTNSRSRSAGGPDVRLLAPVNERPIPARLLEPYLEVLGAEPPPGASFEVCVRHYQRISRRRANEFAWQRLQDEVVERCRATVPADCKARHLITVVGNEPAVVALAPAVLAAKRCLLFFLKPAEGLIERSLREVRQYLTTRQIDCIPVSLDEGSVESLQAQADVAVQTFLRGVPVEQSAFDLTPGLKSLSLALQAAAPVGAWLLYCQHRQEGADNRVVPGSQSYDCWLKPFPPAPEEDP